MIPSGLRFHLTLYKVRLSEMDFFDRLLKIEDEEEEKEVSFVSKLIAKVRH